MLYNLVRGPQSPRESSPCKNDAVCVSEYLLNSYHCDCRPGFCGTHCEQGENRTHNAIKYCNPKAKSGYYVIDPDGEGGVKPIQVYCDMTEKEGLGVTVVSHDSENKTLVDVFDGYGSYSRDVTYYDTSLLLLASLTTSSAHFEQFIEYVCYHSALLFNGDMRGWWVSRNEENMTYWGAADSVPFKFACGLSNNTCADASYGCNFDKNDWEWRNDSGLFTEKSKLPVTQLRFGDTGVIKD
ncbi:Contactin-associated protein-like 2 [Stylophora pistillata]|uniref:Contactin-associated protein-like 2 n=1 Tax=Stylophora pistillata TaxID=50429 RepID=A0A2B4REP4_STYPI|nr:Contactin-associated protein-like 2 [Stylophora pistillata]